MSYMSYILGLSLLLLWSLGYFVPFTIIGFIEILVIIAFLNFLLRKISSLDSFKIRLFKKLDSLLDKI